MQRCIPFIELPWLAFDLLTAGELQPLLYLIMYACTDLLCLHVHACIRSAHVRTYVRSAHLRTYYLRFKTALQAYSCYARSVILLRYINFLLTATLTTILNNLTNDEHKVGDSFNNCRFIHYSLLIFMPKQSSLCVRSSMHV